MVIDRSPVTRRKLLLRDDHSMAQSVKNTLRTNKKNFRDTQSIDDDPYFSSGSLFPTVPESCSNFRTVQVSQNFFHGISIGEYKWGADELGKIYITDILEGRDIYNDGCLSVGDILLSINEYSMIGLSLEQAKTIMNRLKTKQTPLYSIVYLKMNEASNNWRNQHSFISEKSFLTPIRKSGIKNYEPVHLDSTDDTFNDPVLKELLELMQNFHELEVVENKLADPLYLTTDLFSSKKEQISNAPVNLSLDPKLRVSLDQLELALHQIGISPSDSDREKIRARLRTFNNGDVLYGDFVEAVKDVILRDSNSFRSSKEAPYNQLSKLTISLDEFCKLRNERDEANHKAELFKMELLDKEHTNLMIIEELQHLKKQLAVTSNECKTLQRQLHTTEESSIKKSIKEESKQKNVQVDPLGELNKQLAAISSQLKKTEASKRSYEVAVNKLLKFTETVRMFMESESKKVLSAQNKRLQKKMTKINNESQDIIKAVKVILDEEPLPFGWEEVYSKDGDRYYVNHITETTSWIHPVSGIQHAN